MRVSAIFALILFTLIARTAIAAPTGCPFDGNADGRIDIEDLYHLNQNPADINGDGLTNADDIACLEQYLRCAEFREITVGAGSPAGDGLVPWLVFREMTHLQGTEQTFEVDRRPSPSGLLCVGESWTLALLGTNPSLSQPVTLETRRDGFALAPAFMGHDLRTLSTGTTSPIAATVLCPGSSFELRASWNGTSVRSNDRFRALVLRNGHNVTQRATVKGVAATASRSIGGGFIDAYVDGSGVVTLPANEVLVLFELDGVNAADSAFAFDDAAVRVGLNCGGLDASSARSVVLRDSIGPDNALTNGGRVVNTWVSSPPSFDHVAFSLTPAETVTITELSVVVASPTGSSPGIVWSAFDYYVNVWSSPQARAANPTVGDVLNCTFPFPSNVLSNDLAPPAFGLAVGVVPFNLAATSRLVAFNLLNDPSVSCPAVTLQGGDDYVFAIQPIRPTFVNTTMGVVTSQETGVVDWRYTSPNPAGVPVTFYSTPNIPLTGRVGFRVKGVSQ
jgi:hypothetical protein